MATEFWAATSVHDSKGVYSSATRLLNEMVFKNARTYGLFGAADNKHRFAKGPQRGYIVSADGLRPETFYKIAFVEKKVQLCHQVPMVMDETTAAVKRRGPAPLWTWEPCDVEDIPSADQQLAVVTWLCLAFSLGVAETETVPVVRDNIVAVMDQYEKAQAAAKVAANEKRKKRNQERAAAAKRILVDDDDNEEEEVEEPKTKSKITDMLTTIMENMKMLQKENESLRHDLISIKNDRNMHVVARVIDRETEECDRLLEKIQMRTKRRCFGLSDDLKTKVMGMHHIFPKFHDEEDEEVEDAGITITSR